ncbi:PREDICTED: twinfilin-1-like [Acropora digitifera]|uniref:twinfilin-1-like n=1 Tax=Acropora digitifera TaxID=70779 RepID=UPI00077B21DF|nr:PREDICTED: twinfilin-1-like [Acropora digitifera]
MSHQTGIQANEELKAVFAKAREGKIRVIKVDIQDGKYFCSPFISTQQVKEFFELPHYDNAILPLLEEKDPCFLFYRLDSKNNQGYEWLFISYSPDFSKIKVYFSISLYNFCFKMRTDISVDTKQSHMTGVRFPVNESALAKLRELKNKKISLVQLVSDDLSTLSIHCSVAVFVYSMPGYKCSIKDRMLYSTCKGPLLDVAADRIGMTIDRKVGP